MQLGNKDNRRKRANLAGPTRRKGGDYKAVERQMHVTAGGDADGNLKPNHLRPMPKVANPGNVLPIVVKARVGGGHMGSKLCHLGEAPFPEALAEFFVLSYCPPGGKVADCFSGSGTTAAIAVRHGRSFVGCDIRQSQVDLALRRVSNETPLSLLE